MGILMTCFIQLMPTFFQQTINIFKSVNIRQHNGLVDQLIYFFNIHLHQNSEDHEIRICGRVF